MAPAADKKLTGLVAATFTPFTAQDEINLSEIGPYIDYLKEKQGVNSLFVNGTTGESMSLSVAERKILAEEWCLKAKGKIDQVIVHVGCMSLKDSQELARHAAQIGADGIAVISPSFYKPSTAGLTGLASCMPAPHRLPQVNHKQHKRRSSNLIRSFGPSTMTVQKLLVCDSGIPQESSRVT